MEEQKDTQPSQAPQVMDVQPPRQSPAAAQPVYEVNDVPGEPVAAPQDAPAELQEAPADAANPTSDAGVNTVPALAAVPHPGHSRKTPIFAIACAVIVAGAFAAVAVLAYTGSSEDAPSKTTADTTQTTQQPQSNAAKTADVDATSKAIDEQLTSIDDTADYNDNAVSDTTLGL